MTDAVKEQLSACLDGELSAAELDLLLKRVERDGALRESIGGYALIAEALRDQKPVVASRSFAANVMAALEREPELERPHERPYERLWAARMSPTVARRLRPVAGLAVAAGVAAVAVLSVQNVGVLPQPVADNGTQSESATPTSNAPQTLAVTTDESDSYTVPTTTSTPSFVPAIRLTNYVVAHSEYSSPLGRRSVLTGVLAEDDEDRDPVQFEDTAAVEPPAQER